MGVAQNGSMNADLLGITATLTDSSDAELPALTADRSNRAGGSLRELANAPMLAGDLQEEELCDEILRRHVRVARLVDRARPRDPDRLPPLHDIILPAMSPQAFTLAGFKRIEGTNYAQSWLINMPWQIDFARSDTTSPAGTGRALATGQRFGHP